MNIKVVVSRYYKYWNTTINTSNNIIITFEKNPNYLKSKWYNFCISISRLYKLMYFDINI